MRFKNILKPPHLKEGYKIMPPMDKEKYPEMPGLEGPFTMMSGKVVYYDPKEGAYYDKDTDMYMSYDEFQQHDNDYSNMKDERDEVKKEADELNIGAKGDRPYKGPPRQPKRGDPINVKSKGVDPKVLNMFLTNGITEKQLKELSDKDRKEYYRLIKNPHPKRDPNMPNDPGYGRLPPSLPKRDPNMPNDPGYGGLPPNKPIYKPIPGSGMYPPKDPIYKPIPGSGRYPKYPGPEEIKTAKDLLQKARRNSKLMQDDVAVRRDGKTLSKGEKAKLQRQGVLMKEGEEKPYICVHAKKGKHECRAESSYAAAKKAAKHWGLKSTSGIDAYLAVDEGAPQSSPRPKPRPKRIPRPKARPTTNIGSDPVTGSTRGIDPKDNYSPEDLKRLLMQSAMEDMNKARTNEVRTMPLDSIDWPDSNMLQTATDAIRYDYTTNDAFSHLYSMHGDDHGKWLRANEDDILAMFSQYSMDESISEDEEEGMIVYVGDQKFEYADYTIQDAMYIVDEYADEMEGEPYEVYNADGKLVASGTMRSGAFHEPGIEEGTYGKKKKKKKYEAVAEGDGRKKGIHPKGHPMRKKQQAAIHAGESKRKVSMNRVCEAVKQTDPTYAVAMYVRTTLDPSYKTWDQVHEQVKHILSCINEGKTVNANTVMQLLSRKNLQEKADKGMMLKENIDSLRKIVRDKQYQTIKFSDGSMKVDLTTASMFIQVYEKQKPETQAKMDEMLLKKSGFLKLLDVMYSKMS